MIKIQYEDITSENILSLSNQPLEVILDNECFYILISLKQDNENLVVLSGGALDQSKKKPPVFMRSSWDKEIKHNCIYLDDRTIHNKNLKIGWGIGTKERHFLNDYSVIIKRITEILNIKSENTMYYGSSMGGLMSIIMSLKHEESFAFVNNPQTSVFRYYKSFVDQLCDEVFPGMSYDDIKKDYLERFSIIESMLKEKKVPKIYYYQNDKCIHDMRYHLKPFQKELVENKIDMGNIHFNLYSDLAKGHNPKSKEETINIIDNLFDK